jgi:hypothetical protein
MRLASSSGNFGCGRRFRYVFKRIALLIAAGAGVLLLLVPRMMQAVQ